MSFIKLVLILNSVNRVCFSESLRSAVSHLLMLSPQSLDANEAYLGYTFHKILIKLQATFFNRSDPLTLSDCNSVIYQGLEYE